MRKSTIKATFNSDIQTVWDIVTNNRDFEWRSDLSKIEVFDYGKRFMEYKKDGFATYFEITLKEPCKRYEFSMRNISFTGHWVGVFKPTENNGTEIILTEEIHVKSRMMELLSYIYMNLKKIQFTYVKDLKKKLGEID
ncbi:SRPBCC family protein [Romboutsia weinsteinii]|uniref:SRPBCC family protein n=1 Tax=Romboutsia weinsteinii TaxID=2020949 RepID=A0A255I588_9FIRM|nr:SRPBCC family protein [Romboutsia weinsteinii]RDY27270.1 SRPBCC family protein [Romboutsia weinsteinii]